MKESKKKHSLEYFVQEGLHILSRVNFINDPYRYDRRDKDKDCDYMCDIRGRYVRWLLGLREYLSEGNFDLFEISFFYEPDSVPLFDGGLEYSDVCSPKSQQTLDNIKKETEIKLEKIRILARSLQKARERRIKDTKYLIYKNNKGDYFYNGKRIDVSTETTYYKIFDIIYSECNQYGFLSYENIEKELKKKDVAETENEKARNKRIHNAITNPQQSFFRYAKINGKQLQNKTPDSKKMIELVRGKGVKLNNPQII